jgi:hypothetical protein
MGTTTSSAPARCRGREEEQGAVGRGGSRPVAGQRQAGGGWAEAGRRLGRGRPTAWRRLRGADGWAAAGRGLGGGWAGSTARRRRASGWAAAWRRLGGGVKP